MNLTTFEIKIMKESVKVTFFTEQTRIEFDFTFGDFLNLFFGIQEAVKKIGVK